MPTYKELPMGTIERINEDGTMTSFLEDPANADYQEYLESLDEANTL